MTKRFTYIKNNSISQYSILPIQEIGGKTYNCQGVIDKLNKISDENVQLKQLIDKAEDIILSQTTPYYIRQWENIKKNNGSDFV